MDVDLDLDDLDFGDRLKGFLEHKLVEIQKNNESIQQNINNRKDHVKKVHQAVILTKYKSVFSISFKWKKCFNKKYVICYELQNKHNTPLENIKLFLNWSSSKTLTYETAIYDIAEDNEVKECLKNSCQNITNYVIKSNCVHSKGYIFIVMDIPRYLEILEYTISGNILGTQEQKEVLVEEQKEVLVDLPCVQISAGDITNGEICSISLLTGNIYNILTLMLTSVKTNLVFVFPLEWSISLDSTLEIHCLLTKVNIPNSCNKYVTANRVSPLFDDTVISIHNSKSETVVWTTVYSRSYDTFFSILHHLHQHVPGLTVIPAELYERYEMKTCVTNENVPEVLERFQKSVTKEIELIESVNEIGENMDILRFRNVLSDLERDTDLIYLKICELNNCNKDQ